MPGENKNDLPEEGDLPEGEGESQAEGAEDQGVETSSEDQGDASAEAEDLNEDGDQGEVPADLTKGLPEATSDDQADSVVSMHDVLGAGMPQEDIDASDLPFDSASNEEENNDDEEEEDLDEDLDDDFEDEVDKESNEDANNQEADRGSEPVVAEKKSTVLVLAEQVEGLFPHLDKFESIPLQQQERFETALQRAVMMLKVAGADQTKMATNEELQRLENAVMQLETAMMNKLGKMRQIFHSDILEAAERFLGLSDES